jgi:hypothetical protein
MYRVEFDYDQNQWRIQIVNGFGLPQYFDDENAAASECYKLNTEERIEKLESAVEYLQRRVEELEQSDSLHHGRY